MKVTKLLILFPLLLLFACGEHPMTPEEVIKYSINPDNGFIKSKQVAWLKVDAFLKPSSYLVAKKIKQEEMDKSADTQAMINDYESMIYFDLRLSTPNKAGATIENWGVNDQFSQEQRLHYLSFSMKEDLYLLQDGKKIPCELFHFERNYSLSSHRTFICGFPKTFKGNREDLTLVLESDYFEIGPLKLFFSAHDLAKTPQIKL